MSTWLSLGYHVSQFLTGHGSFAANLWRFGCADRPGCDCGGPEKSMEHVLTECPTHQELRERVLSALAAGELWPHCARDIVWRRGFAALRAFALGTSLGRARGCQCHTWALTSDANRPLLLLEALGLLARRDHHGPYGGSFSIPVSRRCDVGEMGSPYCSLLAANWWWWKLHGG